MKEQNKVGGNKFSWSDEEQIPAVKAKLNLPRTYQTPRIVIGQTKKRYKKLPPHLHFTSVDHHAFERSFMGFMVQYKRRHIYPNF